MPDSEQRLTVLAEVVQQLGFDVSHTHEDLVFTTNNLFILRFSDPIHLIDVYFNEEIEEDRAVALMGELDAAAVERGFQVSYRGAYCIAQDDAGTVSVEFFDLTER